MQRNLLFIVSLTMFGNMVHANNSTTATNGILQPILDGARDYSEYRAEKKRKEARERRREHDRRKDRHDARKNEYRHHR